MSLETGDSHTVFIDDDPTHYVDMNLSKDQNYILINNATKEDSEIWVIKNSIEKDQILSPKLLLPRVENVRIHIDHLRDFFVIISNNEANSRNFRI